MSIDYHHTERNATMNRREMLTSLPAVAASLAGAAVLTTVAPVVEGRTIPEPKNMPQLEDAILRLYDARNALDALTDAFDSAPEGEHELELVEAAAAISWNVHQHIGMLECWTYFSPALCEAKYGRAERRLLERMRASAMMTAK